MGIKSFSQYLTEATTGKEATFTFGRFNPPHDRDWETTF